MIKILTADELLKIARKEKPNIHYTRNKQGTALAARKTSEDPWQTVAMKLENGHWCSIGDLYIDDAPCNPPEDWLESLHAHELVNHSNPEY